MIRIKCTIKITLFLVVLLFATQGCLGKKETVQLMQAPEKPVTCSQALDMGADELSDQNLGLIMDQALAESDKSCWKSLVKKTLEQDLYIPMRHLAKAIHAFNANESENEFSLSIHRYFLEIARGKGNYQEKDQNLMKAYLSFEIKRANTKNDNRLKKAKLMCKRLDNELYRKFFL
jgi:hypothetical protein